jgi:hypothetical protein
MAGRRAQAKRQVCSYARLDAFARGQILAYHASGKSRDEICSLVTKTDGLNPQIRAVNYIVSKKRKQPDWRGESIAEGGRRPALDKGEEKQLTAFVFRNRCKKVVTATLCRTALRFLRRVSRQTVRNYLHRAGLAWLRRRPKTWVPTKVKVQREAHCRWILTQQQRRLDRWAYTDGTTFYLARGPLEHQQKARLALGKSVWRMASGKDGLMDDNIGPSMYAKSQGLPVKIWGVFAAGRLEIYVLPPDGPQKTANMNSERYAWLVAAHFASWRAKCFGDERRAVLVQDHEQCLWTEEAQAAIHKAGFDLLTTHPKYSPDLNAIEGQWGRLRARLEKTAPTEVEPRSCFIKRLRIAAAWLNTHGLAGGQRLCVNQKVRAAEILELKGAKCKW